MPTKRPRQRRGAGQTRARRPPKPQSVLVIECDADKLHSQHIHVAGELQEIASALGPSELVSVTTIESLRAGLARVFDQGYRPTVVVVVGHSNGRGVQLASGKEGFR